MTFIYCLDDKHNLISLPPRQPTETHQDVSNSQVDDVDVGGGLHVFPHQDDHHHQHVTSDTDLKCFRVSKSSYLIFDDLIKIILDKTKSLICIYFYIHFF